MKNTELLKKKIDDTTRLLYSYEKKLKKEPTDLALRSAVQSLRMYLSQLQSQYRRQGRVP